MSAKLPLVASVLAACLGHGALTALHADEAPVAATATTAASPEASVAEWIAALHSNDVASFYTSLPPARQLEIADRWKAMTGDPAQPAIASVPPVGEPGQRPAGGQGQGQGQARRGGPRNLLGMMLDRPIQGLQNAEGAKGVAQSLAGILAQFAVLTQPANAPAPAMPAPPEGQPWMQFMQRGMAQNALTSSIDGILAAGLETRQFAALQALFDDYAAWAAKGLDDPAKQTAAAEKLMAVGAALQLKSAADLGTVDLKELLVRGNAALPALKQALLAYGLDADAVLASATVKTESATATESVVVVDFTAFAKPHQLPLKLKPGAAGWEIAADSPALRWLAGGGGMMMRGGMMGGGMMGGGMGGRPRGGQGGGGQGGQQPAQPPGSANF